MLKLTTGNRKALWVTECPEDSSSKANNTRNIFNVSVYTTTATQQNHSNHQITKQVITKAL